MEEFFKLMANYGFPMVTAGYLLVRIEPVLRDLRESVVVLTSVVARQNNIDMEDKSFSHRDRTL